MLNSMRNQETFFHFAVWWAVSFYIPPAVCVDSTCPHTHQHLSPGLPAQETPLCVFVWTAQNFQGQPLALHLVFSLGGVENASLVVPLHWVRNGGVVSRRTSNPL